MINAGVQRRPAEVLRLHAASKNNLRAFPGCALEEAARRKCTLL
jgi:hypothetical protein